MATDKEIAERTLDMQARGKDYSLTEVPGFTEWANNKSANGGSEAAIDSMFSLNMYLLPEESSSVSEADFDEMYEDIVDDFQ